MLRIVFAWLAIVALALPRAKGIKVNPEEPQEGRFGAAVAVDRASNLVYAGAPYDADSSKKSG